MRFGLSSRWTLACLLLLGPLLACSDIQPPEATGPDAEPFDDSIKLLDGLRADVMTGGKPAYRIQGQEGRFKEATRIIELDKPEVQIYDENSAVKEHLTGDTGRMWPVKFKLDPPAGSDQKAKEVEKYDWALQGGVIFQSVQGHRVQAPAIAFDSRTGIIRSDQGLEYQIPSGKKGFLRGEARELDVAVEGAGGGLKQWNMKGMIKLSSASKVAKP